MGPSYKALQFAKILLMLNKNRIVFGTKKFQDKIRFEWADIIYDMSKA